MVIALITPSALADAAEVDVGVERHGLQVLDLDPGNLAGRRQQVVHGRGPAATLS